MKHLAIKVCSVAMMTIAAAGIAYCIYGIYLFCVVTDMLYFLMADYYGLFFLCASLFGFLMLGYAGYRLFRMPVVSKN